jgi:hypothetical protein
MTEQNQKQLGKTLWNIADQLRGAMNADDFRDYMLSFLFLRYLSDNYETAAKKELGRDYPDPDADRQRRAVPLSVWYDENPDDIAAFEKQMRRKVHYVIQPPPLEQHRQPGPHPERGAAEHPAGGLQIHRETNPSRAPSRAVLRDQPRLRQAGQDLRRPQRQALHHHQKIAEGLASSPPTSTPWATPTNT